MHASTITATATTAAAAAIALAISAAPPTHPVLVGKTGARLEKLPNPIGVTGLCRVVQVWDVVTVQICVHALVFHG